MDSCTRPREPFWVHEEVWKTYGRHTDIEYHTNADTQGELLILCKFECGFGRQSEFWDAQNLGGDSNCVLNVHVLWDAIV